MSEEQDAEPATHIVLNCDESGSKGRADREEQEPRETGVFAGILVPSQEFQEIAAEFDRVAARYAPSDGKLHITDLTPDRQASLRSEIYNLTLRPDYDAVTLRSLARRCRNARQSRRLLSIAAIYDGMNRGDAAKVGGMDRQILRDWVVRFNAEGPEGLIDRKAPGPRRRLSEAQMKALGAIVETGPDPAVHGVVRWRRCDLRKLIEDRFGVVYQERAISNLLADLGYSRISGRPQHPAQDRRVMDAFKKTSRARSRPT